MLVEVDPGLRLFVQDVGTGRPVLLLAGFGLTHEVWDRQVRLLAAGHRVVCVDLRGTGKSDKPLDGYGVERLARDVQAVVEQLDLRDVSVVGWSFGAQVAMRLATTAPDRVIQLALITSNGVRASRSDRFPFGRLPDDAEAELIGAEEKNRVVARRRTIAGGFHRTADEDTLRWLVRISLQMPSWAAIACYRSMLRTDLLDDLPKVTMPVLQVIGANDPVQSTRAARWVNVQLPDSRLVEIQDCGHFPLFEAPEEFDEALLQFLAEAVPDADEPHDPAVAGRRDG